jgi:hypothetical protein
MIVLELLLWVLFVVVCFWTVVAFGLLFAGFALLVHDIWKYR